MATKSSSLVSLVLSLILLQLFVSQVCLTEAIRIPRRISPSRRPPPPPPHHYYTPPSKSPRGGGP
ncbi:hypothetical protein Bca4012_003445 [Brassica carinata]